MPDHWAILHVRVRETLVLSTSVIHVNITGIGIGLRQEQTFDPGDPVDDEIQTPFLDHYKQTFHISHGTQDF